MSNADEWQTAVQQLNEQIAGLQARVAALEEGAGSRPAAREIAPGEVDIRLMERLRERRDEPFTADTAAGSQRGALVYAVDTDIGGGKTAWYVERPVPALLNTEPDQQTAVLAALAHPARLNIVLTLLQQGATTSQALQEAAQISSTGQLYHHLKELQTAELVFQPQRSLYAVPGAKIAPLLTILAAVLDLFPSRPPPE